MTTAAAVTPAPIPSPATYEPGSGQRRGKSVVGGAGLFCIWLFAGCMLLCVASGACVLATLARLIIWHRRVYRPLCVALRGRRRRREGRGGGEGVRLVSLKQEQEVGGGGGGGGGVMALYRSVLFISTEGGGTEGRREGEVGRAGERGEEGGEEERRLILLKPAGMGARATADKNGKEGEERGGREGGGEEGGGEREGGREEKGVYRKTLYRLFSRQEEIERWRDVMEECRVSAEDRGRRGGEGGADGGGGVRGGGRGGGVSRKRYSVILREEREEAEGGREELDWVVGGGRWQEGEGGGGRREEEAEQRSSWGEWLAHYLPSMPWGVATPPEAGTE